MAGMENPINTGIVSYGMSGKVFHGPLLHVNHHFNIKKIVERSYKGSKESFPYVEVVDGFEDLIKDDNLELVIVNTPDGTHYEYAKMALDAGKHVVVEKPFTIESSQAEKLIDLAHKKGLMISAFQNRRWDGDFLTVQQIIKKGLLGRLVSYEAHFDRYRNYIQPNTWKEERGPGAEMVYNLGSHMIDQAYVLFGMPYQVYGSLGIQRTGGKIDDFYDIKLYYPDWQVTLKSSYLVREAGPRYILHGTHGSFLKWGIDPQEDALKAGHLPNEPNWGKERDKYWGKMNTEPEGLHMIGRIETLPGNYNAFYDNLYEAIRLGKELIVKPEQSLDVIRIIEGAIESNKTSRAVEL